MKMFASKAAKSKLLAFGVVAMFVLCAVSCVADSDAAGPYGGIDNVTQGGDDKDQEYGIKISTGQTFTYNGIATNLDNTSYGTVKYSWDGDAKDQKGKDGIAWDGTDTLSGIFTTVHEDGISGTLTATWESPTGDDGKTVTQTATQKLTFTVYEGLKFTDGDRAGYGLVKKTAQNQIIMKLPYTGTKTDTSVDAEFKNSDGSDCPFRFAFAEDGGKCINVIANEAPSTTGSWTVILTLNNSDTGDKDSIEITLSVYDGVAFTNSTYHIYTYEMNPNETASYEFEVNYDTDGKDETDVEWGDMVITNPTGYSGSAVLSKDTTKSNVVTINTNDKDIVSPNTKQSEEFVAKLSVTGKVTDKVSDEGTISANTAEATFTLTVYNSLEFMSKPGVTGTIASSVSSGSNSITLSSYISGAKSVKFDWNDGTTTESIVTKTAANYAVNHTYAKAGTYLITITATNDMGTTTSKVMYTVGNDTTTPSDKTTTDTDDKKDTGFFEKHGYLFIVFLILAGLLAFAAFYLGYQIPPVLIAIPVCVVLAVLLFFYKDFGGIIDAIKGLF